MTKRPVTYYEGLLPTEMLGRMNHRCAWKDCTAGYPVSADMPRGWRWLALWSGPVGLPPWGEGCHNERDAVLCPEHAAQLHRELLEPIPEPISKTEGNA